MRNINNEDVVNYIREILPKKEDFLEEIEKYAYENNVPIIHPEIAQLIKVIIKIIKPRNILEIGTAIGYSALVFASNIENDGKVITIERNERMIELAKKNIIKNGYENKIEIINGDANDILPSINGKFDIIFIDAAKSKYFEFLSYCLDNLNPNGIIISDNVLYNGMIANEEIVPRRQKTIFRNMRKYLEYISNHPDLDTTIIPMGDGIALSYKRSEINE